MAARVSLLAVALGVLLCLLTTTVSSAPAHSAHPAGADGQAAAKGTPLAGLVLQLAMPVGPHRVHSRSTERQMWRAIDYVLFQAAPPVARELVTKMSRFITHVWRPQMLNQEQFSFASASMKNMLSMAAGVCLASTPARLARRASARAGGTVERKDLPCFKEHQHCKLLHDRSACYRCTRTCLRIHPDANGCGTLKKDPARMMQSCVWSVLHPMGRARRTLLRAT